MNDKRVEALIKRYKEELIIDEEFKQKLRQSFSNKRNRLEWVRQLSFVAMAAAVLLLFVTTFDPRVPHVNANSLKISNQLSFVDVGLGETVSLSENNGILYLSVKNKGVYSYDKNKFKKILDQKVDYLQINQEGDKILFSVQGSINVYDLNTFQVQTILKGGKESIYNNPSWMDQHKILMSKRVGNTPVSYIIELDLQTMEQKTIDVGDHPSYVKGKDAVLYEKESQIILMDLKSRSERNIDIGHYPSVSSNGEYVTYVKAEHDIENVWISDIDHGSKKQVTENYKNLNTNPKKEAQYSFSYPVWSTDFKNVYVLKQSNIEGTVNRPLQLTKLEFTETKLSPEETVKKYIQALMSREEDFAKSLLLTPPAENLTGSNPRAVGYNILGHSSENGTAFVDAEVYWSYTANPYYQVITVRYYLVPSENGHKISKIVEKSNVQVTALDDSRMMLVNDGIEQLLFKKEDIPGSLLAKGEKFRFASIAYDTTTNKVYFALQYLKKEPSIHSSVILLSYDLKKKSFSRLDHIQEIDGKRDVGVSSIKVKTGGAFLAIDLFEDIATSVDSITYVYNTKSANRVDLRKVLKETEITSTESAFWSKDKLTFQVKSNGQSVLFEYAAEK